MILLLSQYVGTNLLQFYNITSVQSTPRSTHSNMACWHELPIELKVLIAHTLIDVVLADLDALREDIDEPNFLSKALFKILNLATAVPFLRKEMVHFCNVKEARWEKDRFGRFDTDKISEGAVSFLNVVWEEQSWLDFRTEMRSPGEAEAYRMSRWLSELRREDASSEGEDEDADDGEDDDEDEDEDEEP